MIKGNKQHYKNQLAAHKIPNLDNTPHISSKEEYEHQFAQIQSAFVGKKALKLVLSRIIEKTIQPLNLHDLFLHLCEIYPKALVYVAKIGDKGLWCGASPERLIKIEGNTGYTVALAGTKKDKNQAWTPKEREEHRWVEHFFEELERRNKNISLDHKSPPYTAQAGHLYHLKSEFTFSIKREIRDDLAQIFHPTPAVGGYPQKAAIELIEDIENHDRSMYAGYFGLNSPPQQEYYVNIRCMQLTPEKAYVYVGGGITCSSECEEEWKETVAKGIVMEKGINLS